MRIRSQIFRMVLKSVLLTVLGMAMGILVLHKEWVWAFVCLVVTVWLIVGIIAQVNKSNQKIAYFFNAVRNNDSSITFPEKIADKSYRDLHKSMNRVNKLIHDERARSQSNEHLYRSFLDHAASGLIIFNAEGKIIEINNAAKKLLSTFRIRKVSDLKSVEPLLPLMLTQLEAGNNATFSFLMDGEIRKLHMHKAILKTGNETLHMVSIEDIKAELDKTELESWIRLIRVLTHEIMNTVTPITTLSGSLASLYSPGLKPARVSEELLEDTARSLNLIHRHGDDLMHFVHTYRMLTRLPKPKFEEFEITPFLNNQADLFTTSGETCKVKTQVKVHPGNLSIHADESLVARVISNLLINAQHATRKTEQAEIVLEAFRSINNHTVIKIQDNGAGIDPEIMDNIFIPFFTTKKEGSGIGLSLCKQIMHLHKGTISVESEKNVGTVVVLKF